VTKRSNGFTVPPESPAFGVWLPPWRRKPSCPREPISAPHALGLRSSGPCSGWVAGSGFPSNLPLMRFLARPHGLTPALQRLALTSPAAPPALPPFSGKSGARALLSFGTSQVSFRRIFEEAPAFFMPLAPFSPQPPKKPGAGAPGDSFQRLDIPLFRGAPTCLVFPTDCLRHPLGT
jgi:hypothetical protein